MKHRLLTLTLTTCFASSLAFADNPMDAPLTFNDGKDPVVQGHAQKEKTAASGKKHRSHAYKKHEPRPLNAKADQPGVSNPERGN